MIAIQEEKSSTDNLDFAKTQPFKTMALKAINDKCTASAIEYLSISLADQNFLVSFYFSFAIMFVV